MINQVDNRSLSGMLLTETGLKNRENFVFVKKGEHLNLNCTFHHFAEKSRREPKLDDSCSHHPSFPVL